MIFNRKCRKCCGKGFYLLMQDNPHEVAKVSCAPCMGRGKVRRKWVVELARVGKKIGAW